MFQKNILCEDFFFYQLVPNAYFDHHPFFVKGGLTSAKIRMRERGSQKCCKMGREILKRNWGLMPESVLFKKEVLYLMRWYILIISSYRLSTSDNCDENISLYKIGSVNSLISGPLWWRIQGVFWPFKRQTHKMIKHTQIIRRLLPTNCFSVFDHFVDLALKELRGRYIFHWKGEIQDDTLLHAMQ